MTSHVVLVLIHHTVNIDAFILQTSDFFFFLISDTTVLSNVAHGS